MSDTTEHGIVVILLLCYVFIFVCLGSWLFDRAKRFSLREALIAMTVFAIFLSLIVALLPRVQ
jgi:hypothetical protein